MKWMILFACAMLELYGCTSRGDHAERAKDNATASQEGPPTAAASADESLLEADQERWNYFDSKDAMTDKAIHYAMISSKNSINLGFPYQGDQQGTLVIRVKPSGDEDVYFRIDRGQTLCHDSVNDDECPVAVRIDSEDVATVNGSPPDDGSDKTVFLPNEKAFIERLSKGKQLRLGITFYQNGDQVFDFNISGLDLSKLGLVKSPSPS